MDQLIPTLLGIVGALVPVAFAWWQQEQSSRVAQPARSPHRTPSVTRRFAIDDAIIRGGRVYL